jgi:hypothetical protein
VSDKPAAGSTVQSGASDLDDAEPIRIEMDKRVELAVLLAMVALGAAVIYLATGFRIGSFPDPVTTRGLSYVTGGYLIVAGLVLSIRRLLTWSAIPGKYTLSEGNEDERDHPASTFRAVTIMGLAILWAVTVTPIGFLIVTPIVLMAVLWMMDVRTAGKLVGFPIVFAIATWLVFAQLLGVRLPYGVMTGLARSWGLIY